MELNKTKVKHFLNKMLGMKVGTQRRLFAHFASNLEETIKKAKDEETYEDGVVDIRGQSVGIAHGWPVRLGIDPVSNVPLEHLKLNIDAGIDYETALKRLKHKAASNPGGKLFEGEGFYKSRKKLPCREKEGDRFYALLLQMPRSEYAMSYNKPIFKVIYPNIGLCKAKTVAQFTSVYGMGWEKVDDESARRGWTINFNVAKDTCTSKFCLSTSRCRSMRDNPACWAPYCMDTLRVHSQHMLGGAVLPFWNVIAAAAGSKSRKTRSGEVKEVTLPPRTC